MYKPIVYCIRSRIFYRDLFKYSRIIKDIITEKSISFLKDYFYYNRMVYMLWNDVAIELHESGYIRLCGINKIDCNYTLVKLLDKFNQDINMPRRKIIEAQEPRMEWQTVCFVAKDLRKIICANDDNDGVSEQQIKMKYKGINVVVYVDAKRVFIHRAANRNQIADVMRFFGNKS